MEQKGALTLYWGSGSPYSWPVHLALEEKGLNYEGKLLSFSDGDTRKPEYLKINPRGKVPVLVDGEVILYESQAILHYLENAYSQSPLLPSDVKLRATTFIRMAEVSYLSAITSNAQFKAALSAAQKGETSTEEETKAAATVIKEELTRWEAYLQQGTGNFLVGDSFTTADAAVFPWIALFVRFGFPLEKHFPTLAKYYNNIKARESAQKTWPPHWKDSADKTWLQNL